MTKAFDELIASLKGRVNDQVIEIPDLYERAGQLCELATVLRAFTARAAVAAGRLPGAAEGLRIDDLGELLSPDQVRTDVVGELQDVQDLINQAGLALNRAWGHLSRLYVQDDSLADQLRPNGH